MNLFSTHATRLLRQGPFARYMCGESISMMGTWMQQMAQGWVLASLTSSAFTLGLVNFASGLPMLALTMLGGVAADRLDKRWILIIVLLLQATLAVSVGYLVATAQIAVWQITLAGICLGITTAFEMPAASALVPELVDKEDIGAAIAIDRSIFHATRLAGPALGGVLIGLLGTAAAFYANAFSFLALIAALLTLHPRPQGSEAEEKLRQGRMREGWAHVRSDRQTFSMIGLLALTTLCISPFFMIMMPLYSKYVLQIDARQHGFLLGASGVGAMIGSMHLLSMTKGRRTLYLRFAAGCVVLAMTTLALAPHLAVALPAMVVLALGTSTLFGVSNTIVQERAPNYLRGRVSALAGLSFFGILPFAGLLASKLADLVGLRSAMATGGFAFLLGALVLLARIPLQPPPSPTP